MFTDVGFHLNSGFTKILCTPIFPLQEIHKKAFPQSCRYGKYLSFAALVTPKTVLGAEQFAFPCNVFLSRQTLAEEVLSMSRNQNWSLLSNSKSI